MNDKIKDKEKIQVILDEIANLKRYNNELASNTRGEKIENYINSLARNINVLNDKVENIYQENLK